MTAAVSAIIPTLDESQHIAATIGAARAAGIPEVIVADGGSRDDTCRIAEEHGARVITGATMRSAQLNRGAEAAGGDALVFVHADTLLPHDAAAAIEQALGGVLFGGFRVTFAEPHAKLRVVAAMINLRTSLTRCPWGDQAQFVRRSTFLESGGFREIAIMEDYELAVRMKRLGRTAVLPRSVITSGRRFLEKGVMHTAFINWKVIAAYRAGVDPGVLAKMYRT